MSAVLMKILIAEYAMLGIAAATERKLALALYWFGALILNIAVLVMSRA